MVTELFGKICLEVSYCNKCLQKVQPLLMWVILRKSQRLFEGKVLVPFSEKEFPGSFFVCFCFKYSLYSNSPHSLINLLLTCCYAAWQSIYKTKLLFKNVFEINTEKYFLYCAGMRIFWSLFDEMIWFFTMRDCKQILLYRAMNQQLEFVMFPHLFLWGFHIFFFPMTTI